MVLNRGRICPYCGATFTWGFRMRNFFPWMKVRCNSCQNECVEPLIWSISETLITILGGIFLLKILPFSHTTGISSGRSIGAQIAVSFIVWIVLCNIISGCFIPLQKTKDHKKDG